ncbi:hypothetical protein ABZ829_33565 [Streptomyces xanthochromogenes]|uniref:hypothetical protein n=1 Tax=Streptomyces xanthochromogenes TaxID=67384 RepID=UPI003442E3A4
MRHRAAVFPSRSDGAVPAASAGQEPPPSPERRDRVKVPWRLVASPVYADAALGVYMKVKALGRRAEGCTAGTATLARYLGLSKATVERGLAQLRVPAPDGIVELPVNERRSLPGGTGTTARRGVRPMTADEPFVWLPVAACEDLRPRQLRAYAVLCYAQVRRIPLTRGELAGFLRHHSGALAGRPLTAQAAGRTVDALEALGWVTVERRSGRQGRHRFHARDRTPVARAVSPAAPPEAVTGGAGEASGLGSGEGSLVNKEDHRTERPDDEPPLALPAVGEIPVEGGAGVSVTASPASEPTGSAHRLPPRTSSRAPQLTFSLRIHQVLEPVRWLLPRLSAYVQRLVGREVGRQLRDGASVGRVRGRLTRRLAVTMTSDIRDPGRWLVGVALPRRGCANPDCESGVLWSTGAVCGACREGRLDRRAERAARAAVPQPPEPPEPAPRPRPRPEQAPAPAAPPAEPNAYYRACRAALRSVR